jgi:hypothetical protein
MTLWVLLGIFRSAASLTERIASANRDNGCSATTQQTLPSRAITFDPTAGSARLPAVDASLSSGTKATQGAFSAVSTCPVVRKTRSIASRMNPAGSMPEPG